MKTKKRTPVSSVLKALSALPRTNCVSWFGRLSEDDKKWCNQLKKEYNEGKYDHVSRESLSKAVAQELGIEKLRGSAFRDWLRRE